MRQMPHASGNKELWSRTGWMPHGAVAGASGGRRTRTLASLAHEITGGDEIVMLGRQMERFWLSGGEGVTIEFAADDVRVDCWRVEEIIVTG